MDFNLVNMSLDNYLGKLDYESFCKVRKELRTKLKISDTTFINWWKGKTTPKYIYHEKINEITMKYSNIKLYQNETEEQI